MHANVFDFSQLLAASNKPYVEFLHVAAFRGAALKQIILIDYSRLICWAILTEVSVTGHSQ